MFCDERLHPGHSCSGCDRMEEVVVYRKELITAGLDADTQTPAGMRHRSVGSAKLSVLNRNRSFFSKTVGRLLMGGDGYGVDTIVGRRQRKKPPFFFRKATIFAHGFP